LDILEMGGAQLTSTYTVAKSDIPAVMNCIGEEDGFGVFCSLVVGSTNGSTVVQMPAPQIG